MRDVTRWNRVDILDTINDATSALDAVISHGGGNAEELPL